MQTERLTVDCHFRNIQERFVHRALAIENAVRLILAAVYEEVDVTDSHAHAQSQKRQKRSAVRVDNVNKFRIVLVQSHRRMPTLEARLCRIES